MKSIKVTFTNKSNPYAATITLMNGEKIKRGHLVNAYYKVLGFFDSTADEDDDSIITYVSYAISKDDKNVVIEVTYDNTITAANPDTGIFKDNEALEKIIKEKAVADLIIKPDDDKKTEIKPDDDKKTENKPDGGSQSKGSGLAFQAFSNVFSGNDDLWKAFQDGYNMAGGKPKP